MDYQDSKTIDSAGSSAAASRAREQLAYVGMTVKDRYVIKEQLESGGFGTVYLAQDRELVGKLVVIKILSEQLLRNEWAVNKFKQEIEALTRIDHPGVVGVLDAGQMPDGRPFLVMQYVKGISLRVALIQEGMDFERAAGIIRQLGHALDAAHEKGIVHRDLKPENIMLQRLSGSEQVKIIDFGIAKVRDSQIAPSTQITTIVGTIAYMSPEQLNAGPVSVATDIYALGAIGYEMLTGRRPFNPETQFQLAGMQRDGVRIKPRDLRPGLPEAAEKVLLKALSYDPGSRYLSAGAFAESLATALLESGLIAGHVDSNAKTILKTPILKKRTRWRNTVLVGPVAILIAVIVGVVMLSHRADKTNLSSPATEAPVNAPVITRVLDYSLSVQKMRNGRPFEPPYEATGSATLENGYGVRVNLSSSQSGYLYMVNEGPAGNGAVTYNLLFPMPSMNGGSAWLESGQKQSTIWYQLDEHRGTEKFWMIWSAGAVPELEAVKDVVNPKQKGTISDPGQAEAVRAFLTKHSANTPDVKTDDTLNVNHLTVKGDVLVSLLKLEHR